jgi:hypothetical protein
VTPAAGLLAAPLWLAAAVAGAPLGDAPLAPQKIAVEVRGPVALVTVTRALEGDGGGERLLDVTLPDGAALVDVAVSEGGGQWRALETKSRERATHDYLDRLERLGLTPAREPFDDGASFRVRTAADPQAHVALRYRFSLLPETSDGRARIRFPASAERLPAPADVSVSISRARDVEIAGRRGARARVSTRSGWEVSWDHATSSAARLDASLAFAKISPKETLTALSVEALGRKPVEPPPSVLFLVDRSRSVGLPGLSAERDLVGRLLEALPPSTRFDALFFDRQVRRLFPMSRPATREALAAFEAEMVPDRLRNGTDLPAGLREAGALLRREASAFAPRAWLVVVTDGALPEAAMKVQFSQALGATPGIALETAVFVVRPAGDDPAPSAARYNLATLMTGRAGILRELAANELDEALPRALAALARGGDVFRILLAHPSGLREVVQHLAPGEGRAEIRSFEGRPTGIYAYAGGAGFAVGLPGQSVDPTWLRMLARKPPPDEAHLYASGALVALVETPARPAPAAQPEVRGSLDRTVVRNTLSLAYMPRARACYLNRTSATPAERDLRGRVRLAIDLTRGEVGNAVVQSSTLNHPGIEGCLRDGAFEIEVPRTLRSDSPSTAILNLVFRPRTPEKSENPGEAALGEQIDLVIEELHRAEPAPAEEAPAVDRSMIPTR